MPTDRTATRSAEVNEAIEDLVDANHILADQGTVDGFGHVSVRHPTNPTRYLLSKNVAPAAVTKDDIIEFDLDSVPVDAKGRALYLERFIHGEIYKARPDVQSVVNAHSPWVLSFAASKIPLRAVHNKAAFLGAGSPIFDIRDAFGATDMLLTTPRAGEGAGRHAGQERGGVAARSRSRRGRAIAAGRGISRPLRRVQRPPAGAGDVARRLHHLCRRRRGREGRPDHAAGRPAALGAVESKVEGQVHRARNATEGSAPDPMSERSRS